MTLSFRLICLLFGLCLSLSGRPAFGNGDLIEIGASDTQIGFSNALEYVKTKRFPREISPSDVDASVGYWKPVSAANDSLGLRAGSYWLRATLVYHGDQPRNFLLINDYPSINNLSLYAIDANGTIKTLIENAGLATAQLPRAEPQRKLAAELTLKPDETITLLWQVESKPLFRFRPTLWEKTTFEANEKLHREIFFRFYCGLAALSLYAILLWLKTRNKTHGYYLVYLLTTTYMIAANQGDLYVFVLPDFAWPKVSLYVIMYALNVSSFCLLISTYLNLRERLPGQNLSLQITAGTSGLLMLIGGFFDQQNAALSAIWLSTFMYLLALMTSLRINRLGLQKPIAFITGLSILILGMLATSLALSGVLPETIGAETYSAFGSGLMLLLCAIGLFNAINHAAHQPSNAPV